MDIDTSGIQTLSKLEFDGVSKQLPQCRRHIETFFDYPLFQSGNCSGQTWQRVLCSCLVWTVQTKRNCSSTGICPPNRPHRCLRTSMVWWRPENTSTLPPSNHRECSSFQRFIQPFAICISWMFFVKFNAKRCTWISRFWSFVFFLGHFTE